MTEEQYEKAKFIKSGINKCEEVLRHDIKGVFYQYKGIYPTDSVDRYVSLGNEVNEKIKKIIEERLEQFKKEFEEL